VDAETRRLLLSDPALFIVTYFPHRISKLESFHMRLVESSTQQNRALILYPAGHGKCLRAGTLVLMEDGTLVKVEDVKVGDRTALGVCQASQSNGVQPTVRVTLRTGQSIVTTFNHPFLLETGKWVMAAHLTDDDECVLVSDFEAPGVDLPNEAFRLLGYLIGDGSLTGSGCRLTTADDEIADDFANCLTVMGFKLGAIHKDRHGGKCSTYSAIGGCMQWLKEIGVFGFKSKEKHVPEIVFKASNEQIRHFLAAYHACDGNYSKGTSGYEFYSVSEELLKGVQHLLLRVGVVAALTLKNGRYLGERHISYRLRIPTAYFDEIRKWPKILPRKRPDRSESMVRFLPTVASVEDAGEQETWSLQIEGGTHYTGDILTHNTTLVSTLLPIWAICRDPNTRVAIIAKNTNEGEGIVRSIQSEMIDNTELVRDFGPFRPQEEGRAWSLGRIDVQKRTRRGKESTLAMFGAQSKDVLGYRTDWTICDDVVTNENSATPEQRQKMRNWFDLAVETGPEHITSRLTVVGTRFDPNDLYGDLIEMGDPEDGARIYSVQREDAIVDEEAHTTLWPYRWPWKRLMQKKAAVGTLNFNKRYRNIAVDASRMLFKEEYVRGGWVGKDQYPGCLDRHYQVGDFDEMWRKAAGFDPAVGSGRSAKFCAHMTLGQGSCAQHERCYWVIDLERDQWSLPQQVELVMRQHQKYRLITSQVEANSYQMGLNQSIDHKMNELGVQLNIVPHYTTRTNKPDAELGVQSMAPWFERGNVHIPWADAFSQRRMKQFVEELIMFPDGRTTDTVMAFWFAWRALEVSAPIFGAMNRLERDAPMWSRTLHRRQIINPAYRQRGEATV
jgi:predicted phage terminase large subunit-like protein